MHLSFESQTIVRMLNSDTHAQVKFPEERAGIDRYFQLLVTSSRMVYFHKILKVIMMMIVMFFLMMTVTSGDIMS